MTSTSTAASIEIGDAGGAENGLPLESASEKGVDYACDGGDGSGRSAGLETEPWAMGSVRGCGRAGFRQWQSRYDGGLVWWLFHETARTSGDFGRRGSAVMGRGRRAYDLDRVGICAAGEILVQGNGIEELLRRVPGCGG